MISFQKLTLLALESYPLLSESLSESTFSNKVLSVLMFMKFLYSYKDFFITFSAPWSSYLTKSEALYFSTFSSKFCSISRSWGPLISSYNTICRSWYFSAPCLLNIRPSSRRIYRNFSFFESGMASICSSTFAFAIADSLRFSASKWSNDNFSSYAICNSQSFNYFTGNKIFFFFLFFLLAFRKARRSSSAFESSCF